MYIIHLFIFLINLFNLPTKVLMGNKSDLDLNSQISHEEAQSFADAEGLPYFEVSMKEGSQGEGSQDLNRDGRNTPGIVSKWWCPKEWHFFNDLRLPPFLIEKPPNNIILDLCKSGSVSPKITPAKKEGNKNAGKIIRVNITCA
jgi:hypothetical protein